MELTGLMKLHEQLLTNTIEIEQAKSLFFEKKNTKAWHTKDWRKRRDLMLQEKCEQCGSKDTLVLQHQFHPKNYGECKYLVICKYGEEFNKQHPIDTFISDDEVFKWYDAMPKTSIKVCPKCYNRGIRERKTLKPILKCDKCKHTFNVPKNINSPLLIDDRHSSYPQKSQSVLFSKLKWDLYKKKCNERLKTIYAEEIERATMIMMVEDLIRYLSFKDTVTWCKKCAFNYDINHANLCPTCKKNYKLISFSECKECHKNNTLIK